MPNCPQESTNLHGHLHYGLTISRLEAARLKRPRTVPKGLSFSHLRSYPGSLKVFQMNISKILFVMQ